jgi:hypothetical protein
MLSDEGGREMMRELYAEDSRNHVLVLCVCLTQSPRAFICRGISNSTNNWHLEQLDALADKSEAARYTK